MRLCWGKKSILVLWMQIYIAETGGDCDVEAGLVEAGLGGVFLGG